MPLIHLCSAWMQSWTLERAPRAAVLVSALGWEGGAGAPKSDHHCSCFLRGLEAQNSDHPPLTHICSPIFSCLCLASCVVLFRLVKALCEVERTSRNKCDTRCYLAILIVVSYDPFSAQGDMMMNYRDRVESRLIVGTLDPPVTTSGGTGKCVN